MVFRHPLEVLEYFPRIRDRVVWWVGDTLLREDEMGGEIRKIKKIWLESQKLSGLCDKLGLK
jgi:hypothetical protein